ncbi:hypothetical protein HYZ98_00485 [Candidatus Peregrinibacteria bacterium]|nr:hypothetical protein [Candidatus Peregrinibacteria bacterium]
MHVRLSTCRGMAVLEEGTQDFCGWIHGILLHPETGKVEGFSVGGGGREGFLSRDDVVRWGKCVWVRSVHVLGPLEDIVRLRTIAGDSRHILGQRIRTESGRNLGKCADVQFSTGSFELEWIFPRKLFLFWGTALPRSEIIEVTSAAIIVRDPIVPKKEKIMSPKDSVRLEELVEVPKPS